MDLCETFKWITMGENQSRQRNHPLTIQTLVIFVILIKKYADKTLHCTALLIIDKK